MISKVKKIIFSNTFFYKIWFILWRSRRGDQVVLPKKGDKMYFDGYPRSGNTYLAGMIHYFFPGAIQSSHLHAVIPLKIALNKKIPTLIIFRDPLNCVASNHFTKTNGQFINSELLNNQLLEFIEYYRYVINHKNLIQLVNFDDVIARPATVVNGINEGFGLNSEIRLNEKDINDYDVLMQSKEKKKKTASGSLPNEKRTDFKTKVFGLIQENPNYSIASDLHKELVLYAS